MVSHKNDGLLYVNKRINTIDHSTIKLIHEAGILKNWGRASKKNEAKSLTNLKYEGLIIVEL